MHQTSQSIRPGFIALHGNRAEDLAQVVISWLRRQPLAPLEQEVVVVQSSGMSEWLKMELARQTGVCSAVCVELPGRFLWRTYRQTLGPGAVPSDSPLDKLPMTWRLMQILPGLLNQEAFKPIAQYLRPEPEALPGAGPRDMEQQLQLAAQLADLFDQYQNYRADWLNDWAAGHDQLRDAMGGVSPLAPDQLWQAALWRAALGTLQPEEREATRPRLNQQVIARLNSDTDAPVHSGTLPRRIVVFGMSHIPGSMLETLAALARHCQVILAVPNPCRFYWGDIMEGRELLKAERRRQKLKKGVELAALPMESMHLHAHPLLAAWGRQGRDFIRQLDAFDDAAATRQAFPNLRIDVFDEQEEDPTTSMLQRVQRRIRDLEPLAQIDQPSTTPEALPAQDRSIMFHVAHSAVRELEVLHDQLLQLLAQANRPDESGADRKPLNPRDIVVMVPDVQTMAPAIRAVFGQYGRSDERRIPFDIADLNAKSSSPLITAVEWLLRISTQRCGLSELVDLLEVPAISKRFGIDPDKLPQLTQWMAGSGVRWGLNEDQRGALDLAACGDQNSAEFGLERMLLGYAAGSLASTAADGWHGIEPFCEVGGLDAELAGAFAHLLQALTHWWNLTQTSGTPAEWKDRALWLLAALFEQTDDTERDALSALRDAVSDWVTACDQAGFDTSVPVAALRHGWLEALDTPSLDQRFRAGGVTFCTLMPMRAIPFEVVCLIGMNDGDYPRRSPRSDFDLMGLAGQFRPGDRSRQHDDRQLMLEALLAARRTLYVSWSGRSVRDNSEQPPSVLVSQLRDYIEACWGKDAVTARTTTHPLQPFSRHYFEAGGKLTTYAKEWRDAHGSSKSKEQPAASEQPIGLPAYQPDPNVPLTLERLVRFYRNPVKTFFQERFGVSFWNPEEEPGDTEAFSYNGLEQYALIRQQLSQWPSPAEAAGAPGGGDGFDKQILERLAALRRSGELPMKGLGQLKEQELALTLQSMGKAWVALGQEFPLAAERIAAEFEHSSADASEATEATEGNSLPATQLILRDWIDKIQANDVGERCWVDLEAGKLLSKDKPRPNKLLTAWLRSMLASAAGQPLHGRLIGPDGEIRIQSMAGEEARNQLALVLEVWYQGMQEPLPLPLKTGLAAAQAIDKDDKSAVEKTYEGGGDQTSAEMAEVQDMSLARMFPDFSALEEASTATGERFYDLAERLYVPMLDWVRRCVSVHA